MKKNHLFEILSYKLSAELWFFLSFLLLFSGTVRDNKKAGVLEPTVSKVKSLKFATEAAITILRIDDMIKLDAEQKGGRNYQQAMESGELYG